MDRSQLDAHLARLGTPPAGCRLVVKAFQEAPVRDVACRGGRSNIVSKFFSRKMDRHLRLESKSGELPAAIRYERSKALLAYLAQPVTLDLILTDGGTKRPYRIGHTPDFLGITETEIFLEEWHPHEWLRKESDRRPGRYKQEDGRWRWPEVEAQLAEIGISYRLRANEEHATIYVRNIEFLADYFTDESGPIGDDAWSALAAQFADRAVIPLSELIGHAGSPDDQSAGCSAAARYTVDDIYRAVAEERLAFDIDNEIIDETHTALIYRDEASMIMARRISVHSSIGDESNVFSINAGDTVTYDGSAKRIVLVGGASVTLSDESGATEVPLSVLEELFRKGSLKLTPVRDTDVQPFNAMNALTSEAICRANHRARIIELANAGTPDPTVSRRTVQSWKRLLRLAGPNAEASNVALAGRHSERGNRTRRMGSDTLAAIHHVVTTQHNNANCQSKSKSYKDFIEHCHKEGIKSCSYRSFRLELNKLEKTRERSGKRVAYQTAPIVWYLDPLERIHGVRPFQYVHMDHTTSDIELIDPYGVNLGRPTLSLAMDADSRDVLGLYLSFLPPSYLSCMMLFRDIARRCGRLPETVVVDNGKEFHSESFERFCELYKINIRYRPAAKPRAGSVLERLFRTTDLQLIHNLSGNTKAMRAVRSVTKSHLPKNSATWTLPALHGALDFYFTALYGTDPHPAHDQSPHEYLTRRLTETGVRRNRLVRLDETFLIETCPEVDRGTRIVDSQRGVKIDHVYYTCDALRQSRWHGKEVRAKVDPWDASRCFVLLDKKWHTCTSHARLAVLTGLTRLEMLAYFEQRAIATGTKKQSLSAQRISDWMRAYRPEEFDPRLRGEVLETRSVYDSMGITSVVPPTANPARNRGVIESAIEQPEDDLADESSTPASDKEEDYGTF